MVSMDPTSEEYRKSNVVVLPYLAPVVIAHRPLSILPTIPYSFYSSPTTDIPDNYYSTDTSTDTSTPDNTMLYVGLGVLILIIIIKI